MYNARWECEMRLPFHMLVGEGAVEAESRPRSRGKYD